LTEEEIEEMNLVELQQLDEEWKSYHKLEKFKVSAFKRLELQLRVQKWRKDTIRQNNIFKMHKNTTKSDNNIQERAYSEIALNLTENNINKFKKRELIGYLYLNSGGTKIDTIEELNSKENVFIQKQVLMAETFPTAEDCLVYITMSTMEEDETMDIFYRYMQEIG